MWLHSLEVNEGIDCISNEFDCLYLGEDPLSYNIVHTSPKPSASIPDAKTMSERDKRVSSAACDTTRQNRHGAAARAARAALPKSLSVTVAFSTCLKPPPPPCCFRHRNGPQYPKTLQLF